MNDKSRNEYRNKLLHLTESEIITLMERYYKGENAKKLVEEYHIDVAPSMLSKTFPPVICNDIICQHCNIPMVRDRPSKTSINEKKIVYCPNCGHQDDKSCKCKNCTDEYFKQKLLAQQELQKNIVQNKILIREVYKQENFHKIKLDDIPFRERTYLGALCRLALSEDMTHILPLEKDDRNLSPTTKYTQKILVDLTKNDVIHVSPDSDVDAFLDSSDDINFPNTYYTEKVAYEINIDFEGEREKQLTDIINPQEFCENNKQDALIIWKEIALEECLEYFKIQMEKVNFDFSVGEKTTLVFQDLLQQFSVSQIYGIIYKSISNATRYFQEGNVSKKRAANSVIGGCQRYGEQAITSDWPLKKCYRNYDIPQSMISEFLFNRVLQIGNLGFDMPPTEL